MGYVASLSYRFGNIEAWIELTMVRFKPRLRYTSGMSRPETALDAWLYPDTNGDIYIVDPATQQALEGDIPQFVRQDKRLARGLEAFSRFPISAEIALVRHAVASDLDMPGDPMWYEKATSDPSLDVYAYESLYCPPGGDCLGRAMGHAMRLGGEPKQFVPRFYRALSKTTAISGPFDPDMHHSKERIALSLDWTYQKSKLLAYRAAYDGPAWQQTQRYVTAFAVSQIVREGIMPAKMGLLINRAAKRRALEGIGDSYRQLVSIGATHRRQEQIVRNLGAQVTVRELPLTEEDLEQAEHSYNLLRKGVVSPEDISWQHEKILHVIQGAKERSKRHK